MAGYVDLAVIGRVLLYSLAAGIVVTGAFALGARSLAYSDGARASARPARLAFATAMLCFAFAAGAVGAGLWFVLDKR